MTKTTSTYCGFVAVIGATNTGKSTLINRLVAHKVSIVSRKVQTTRSRVLGLIQNPKHQIILADTPGIFRAKTRLERAMVDVAWRSITDTGMADHVVDCL
ncbi:MAG: 50S ribosome-binding GTPase, partial [Alphaproteobacteria bacterium]|nr:50S ribosome-binding GTPase [Alphaproteobacteria bacterium]